MTKIFLQLSLTVLFFFGAWFGLSQIDWMGILKVDSRTDNLESQLGDLLEEQILTSKDTTLNPQIYGMVRDILDRLCRANDIDSSEIKLHVVADSEINAFAMPNSVMVVNKGLILASENEDALAGVIGHELAHISEQHVMRRLIRELGLSLLVNMTTGSSGAGVSQVVKQLTSSSYDRDLESEADLKSVDYLQAADISPTSFAEFMYFMSTQVEIPEALQWLSSHPESESRSKAILAAMDSDRADFIDIIPEEEWLEIKEELRDWD